MNKKRERDSAKEFIIQYLKNNKDIFLNYPELLEELDFPIQLKGHNKVFDLNAYRSRKFKNEYDEIKIKMSEIIKAGSSHLVSQKRILKSSLKVLNTKSLTKLIDLIVNDFNSLLACDVTNCFCTSDKLKHNGISQIDRKVATSYFRDKFQTNLNQNPKGILVFFPNKSKIIKSYILLKINYNTGCFVVALGSKNLNKFTKNQQIDLIEYLIKIIEIKLVNLH